jgi:hypothetical protein
MKSLALALVFFVAGTVLAYAAFRPVQVAAAHEEPTVALAATTPVVTTPAEPEVTYIAPITVVGYVRAPSHRVWANREFVCGEVYENAIGGHNSDCYWR